MRKISLEERIERFKKLLPVGFIYVEFQGIDEKGILLHRIACSKGHEKVFRDGQAYSFGLIGCRKCTLKKVAEKRALDSVEKREKMRLDSATRRVNSILPDGYVNLGFIKYRIYKDGSKNPIFNIQCPNGHKYEFLERRCLKTKISCQKCAMTKFNKSRILEGTELFSKNLDTEKYEFLNFDREKYLITVKCKTCGKKFTAILYNIKAGQPVCPKCFPANKSQYENEIHDFLVKECNVTEEDIQRGNRNVLTYDVNGKEKNFEMDIYLPTLKLGIEFHGLYWHSTLVLMSRMNYKEALSYHMTKANLAEKAGVRLIQIFEDEWLYKKEVFKKLIKNALNIGNERKIFARKCVIQEVSYSEAKLFLNKNHFQGAGKVGTIRLGLYFEDILISLMNFRQGSKSQNIKKEEGAYDLYKYATSCKVTGGLQKLLTYFERKYAPKKIYTFCDRRLFTGSSFIDAGFVLKHTSSPNYFYFKEDIGIREHRFKFKKNKEAWDLGLTEFEYWDQKGFLRIYDAGHLKLEKTY